MEVDKLRDLLKQPLTEDNGAALSKQLSEAEAWAATVSYHYRLALKELYQMRRKFLLPKSREHSDLDRKTYLEADTAEWQYKADELRDLQEILQKRISLGQTFLRSLRGEAEHGL